jgi:diguanylate cyclase (GGDEF)-like protein/PAS domain S-box-containing protein
MAKKSLNRLYWLSALLWIFVISLGFGFFFAYNEYFILKGQSNTGAFIKRIFVIALLNIIFVILAGSWFYYLAQKMKRELDVFISFFNNLSVSHENIDKSKLKYEEFIVLSDYANKMNEEIQYKTQKMNKEILERRQVQDELIRLSQAVEQSPSMVVITDLKNKIVYANPKFSQVTGYTLEEVKGRGPKFLNSGFHSIEFYKELWETILAGKEWEGDFHNRKKNGEIYWESAAISTIKNTQGKKNYYLKVSNDVTEKKRLEQNLEYLAHHDSLTGLPNRVLFSDRLNQSIVRAKRYKKMIAVIMADLDNFKTVNDTLGHDAGDNALKLAVKRFLIHIREQDTASRIGGDEFAFIINDIEKEEDLLLIVNRMIEGFQEPFRIDRKEIRISPSMGIAYYPHDGNDIETLLKNADAAMYLAKEKGKNNYQFYKNGIGRG